MQMTHTGGTAAVGGVAAVAALLEALSVGTLVSTWQPLTAERLALATRCEKGTMMFWNTELLLAASMRRILRRSGRNDQDNHAKGSPHHPGAPSTEHLVDALMEGRFPNLFCPLALITYWATQR
jgi:hypothetical protein